MAIKVYEPADDPGEPAAQHEFALIFKRDGVRERHEFLAEPQYDWKNLRSLLYLMDSRRGDQFDPRAFTQIDRLVRRALVNTDGTPEKWKAKVVSNDGEEPWFTDPNGDHAPAEMLPVYEAFGQGSSRRRWAYLMDEDDEVTVDFKQVIDLMQDLMEVAGKDRGKNSAASSG
jgi:hypothetical protein